MHRLMKKSCILGHPNVHTVIVYHSFFRKRFILNKFCLNVYETKHNFVNESDGSFWLYFFCENICDQTHKFLSWA